MEPVRRFGGTAGVLLALSGAGITYFAPDHRIWGWCLLVPGAVLALLSAWLNRDDLLNLIKGRPFRHGANAVFYSLLVLGIVGAVDFLGARHNHRFDLTEGGVHSLSGQTIKILESLGQDVTIVAFYRPTNGGQQQAMDLLDEYKYHSSRLDVRFVDPFRSPGDAKAYEIEVEPTIVVSCKDGKAKITPTAALSEEDLTNALVKATSTTKKVVCFSTGHGEKRIEDAGPNGLQQVSEAIKKETFETKEVKLLEGGSGLADCSSLVVAGATHAMLEPEVESVKGYLKGGGRLLVLREPRTPTGLEPLLEKYGLKAAADIVVDVNPMSRLLGGSPAAPVVYEYTTHPITKDLEGLATIFPMAGSIETIAPTEPDVTTETLARTSAQSWGEMGDVTQKVAYDAATEKAGPLNIAAVAVAKHPEPPAAADANAPAQGAGEEAKPPAKEARVVLFGNAEFAANSTFMVAGNKDLLLNTVAWLNERSELISIRPKKRAAQPVVLTAFHYRALLLYGLVLLPLAMAALGTGVYVRRRRL